ncbi:MAG: RNA polymerase sigma factor [Gemmataceae bacterium]
MSRAIQSLRIWLTPPSPVAESDGDLLDRFVLHGEEAAFALLVQRHGPMIFNVCRRVLLHEQDAEDAYQATFVVLARRAAALDRRGSLASWLYKVAYHAALKMRELAAKRRETAMKDVTALAAPGDWAELRPVLDAELDRLPDKYRAPVLLCYLQGLSNEEAARQLDWPVGTVKGRLARARDLLRGRLARRGVTLSATAIAALVTEHGASASVPGAVVARALQAARCGLAGQPGASGTVQQIAQGVMSTMRIAMWKRAGVMVLGLALVAGGLGWVGLHALAVPDLAQDTPERPVPFVKDGLSVELRPLRTEFTLNEPLAFQIIYRNVSEQPISLSACYNVDGHGVYIIDRASGRRWEVGFVEKVKPSIGEATIPPGKLFITHVVGSLTIKFTAGEDIRMRSLPAGNYTAVLERTFSNEPSPYSDLTFWAGKVATQPVAFRISGKEALTEARAREVALDEINLKLPKWEDLRRLDAEPTFDCRRSTDDKYWDVEFKIDNGLIGTGALVRIEAHTGRVVDFVKRLSR